MLEIVAIFSLGAVDDHATVAPLFGLIDEVAGLDLSRYDLNQMEHWRAWEPERASIDALTQRTQVLRAEGAGMFFFALGKHGEVPTAVVRTVAEPESIEIQKWFGIDRLMELRITSESWRAECADLPQVWAWRSAPAGAPVVVEDAAKVWRVDQATPAQRESLRASL